jgi:filamentous hemagglutinin
MALRLIAQRNATMSAKIRPDTSMDGVYAAKTDRTILADNNFDMAHVLTGEINDRGRATGHHAEIAANGEARIAPGATVTQNANGTYQAPVQIWDGAKMEWVSKKSNSTFFPPSWSEARITYEVTEAFKKGTPSTNFLENAPSGIQIQFYWDSKNQRTTFYPLGAVK